jgi:Cu-processing system ATP-binding protein
MKADLPVIALEGVAKRYGAVQAVRDVSFSLPQGARVALVGHNGAGKTTLMKLMLGLIRPTSGSIEVLGDDPAAGQFAARRELGFLPENVAFNSGLSGRETLAFYARLKRQPASAVAPLLERVGLTDAAGRRLGTYSKGMRQRLGLAQALLGRPRVLLLDEPTTGLDPALRQSFYDTVEELRGHGVTVLLSSHALTELEERAGRVIIMNRGIKVADGSLDELRRIARLPTKIRLRVTERGLANMPEWLGPLDTWRRVNGRTVEIDASPEGKIELLRRATDEAAPVEDLDVLPPTLDQLYAYFLRSEAAAL